MAAMEIKETATQPELMDIAKEILANKIDILASGYLNIDDSTLSHIRDEANTSVITNFKCLLHWCRNDGVELKNARQVLCEKLCKAAKEDLISQKGADILKSPVGSTDADQAGT